MIARYKGLNKTIEGVPLKPGSLHTVKIKNKIFSKNMIWLNVNGCVTIPYELEELFIEWEPVKE